MKTNTKLLLSRLILLIALFFSACDGAEVEELNSDFCVFAPQVVSIVGEDPEAVCTVEFFFIDDLDNEYQFFWNTNSTPNPSVFGLPKNRCYRGWILDSGNGNCGYITFALNDFEEECTEVTELVNGEENEFDINHPEFEFCLDDVCTCPDDINSNEYILPCNFEVTNTLVDLGCNFCVDIDPDQVFADWNEGYSIASGINIANCGTLEAVYVVWTDAAGFPSLSKGILGDDLCNTIPCGATRELFLSYSTEICGNVGVCPVDLVCDC